MKTVLTTFLLGLAILFPAQAQKNTEMDYFTVQVDGLGCPFCAYGLEKKFKEFESIKKVKIDIETGDFSFSYPSNRQLSLNKVLAQVNKAGYTPNEAKIIRANGTIETNVITQEEGFNYHKLEEEELVVLGNCGMCKARIEKAVTDIDGVAEAFWNQNNKRLKVSFNKDQTTIFQIKKATAAAGHDAESLKAPIATYTNLPACCQYKRNSK